ncbi:hypothetical protein, partial [Pseudomonas syringae]|uniref:hypothetical protein n=1 Tax=Pseudomonas syringae TaxID=317 RepID=UPI001F42A753
FAMAVPNLPPPRTAPGCCGVIKTIHPEPLKGDAGIIRSAALSASDKGDCCTQTALHSNLLTGNPTISVNMRTTRMNHHDGRFPFLFCALVFARQDRYATTEHTGMEASIGFQAYRLVRIACSQ